jgi:heme-degrading monooxygenase HmoA
VIRSVLYLRPRNGRQAEIVDFYRRHGVLELAAEQEGCLGADLQVPTNGSGELLVTALWRDVDAYRRWLANPARAQNAAELVRLVDGFDAGVSGETYEIVLESDARQ